MNPMYSEEVQAKARQAMQASADADKIVWLDDEPGLEDCLTCEADDYATFSPTQPREFWGVLDDGRHWVVYLPPVQVEDEDEVEVTG